MMERRNALAGWRDLLFLLSALISPQLRAEDAAPLEAFARTPHVADVSISHDKRFLAFITSTGDLRSVVIHDRTGKLAPKTVWSSLGRKDVDVEKCFWANATRLLCDVRARIGEPSDRRMLRASRLLAVNFDGSDSLLLADREWTSKRFHAFQSELISLTPGDDAGVLIKLLDYPPPVRYVNGEVEGEAPYSIAYRVDIYTGELTAHTWLAREASFIADASGRARLAVVDKGLGEATYHHRRIGESEWRPWAVLRDHEPEKEFRPLHAIEGTNRVLAIRTHLGRRALWDVDVRNRRTELLFSSPSYDVGELIRTAHGVVLGVERHEIHPAAQYFDDRARSVIAGVSKFHPDEYHAVYDATADGQTYLIRSSSDVHGGAFRLADFSSGPAPVELIGTAYPELAARDLSRMEAIEYRARDGVMIPGYFTAPKAPALGLVVMPHDGPADRTKWEFDYFRAFLVSRGYAVLQMNYRGSSGYGWAWRQAGFRQWDGKILADIADGARWAVAERGTDAKRVCIAGFGFGGYQALMGAAVDPDLYRCAISIGSWSDLRDARAAADAFARQELPASNRARLYLRSPLRWVEAMRSPIFLAHAQFDMDVPVGQAIALAQELKRRCKSHELLVLEGADGELRWQSERTALLAGVERFLAANLAKPPQPASCL